MIQIYVQMKQDLINVNNTFFFLFVTIVFTQHSFWLISTEKKKHFNFFLVSSTPIVIHISAF